MYYNKTFTLTSCQEENFGVCAYQKLDQLVDNICGSELYCLQSDFTSNSKCFCKKPTTLWVNAPKAEFIKPYQYSIYSRLTDETCAIGLVKNSDGQYVWYNSKKPIEYTFWSKNMNFENSEGYGAATPDGWILTTKPTLCALIEVEIPNAEPFLNLQFDESKNQFSLEVRNLNMIKTLYSKPLLFCFTDADNSSLIYRYSIVYLTLGLRNRNYYFNPVGVYPGRYWCEAFKFVDLEVIRSEVYFYRLQIYPEFVAILSICYNNSFDPLSKDFITAIQNSELFRSLKNNLYIQVYYQIKVAKIIDVDEETKRVLLNIHFSSNFKNSSSVDEDRQYSVIKNVLIETIDKQKEQIKLIDFLSADYCANESTELSWPKTNINTSVYPAEICLTPDGNRVTRLCYGDFLNGARWSDFDNCEIFKISTVTEKLLQFSNNSNFSFESLSEISKNYWDFEPVDVYFLGQRCNESLSKITDIDVTFFSTIISSVVKINNQILFQSQIKLGATDVFLSILEKISRITMTFQIFLNNAFVHVSIESENLSGLAVEKQGNNFVVNKLSDDHSVSELVKSENLECAIWLSPQLRQQISREDKITIWIFFNASLFQQVIPDLQTSIIFGILKPTSLSSFVHPIRALFRVEFQKHKHFCSKWAYSKSERGYWRISEEIHDYKNFVLCEFQEAANFALVSFNDNANVTDDLIDLLDSNDTVSQTMDKLFHISERYILFKPIDVSIVGQILDKVNYDETIDLEILAFTVSNLHNIDRKILTESQLTNRSTDLILDNIDIIMKKQNLPHQVLTKNFFVLILNFTKSFNGLLLLNHDGVFEPFLLEGNYSIAEVSDFVCFDSAVILSPELKNQIPENEKIIITVFFNDALFNEKSPETKFVSKVFGIILPPLGEYQGPVSIYHKTEKLSEKQCVFWNYNLDKIPGFWKNETESKNFENLTRCDFWHTTHFAQLIIDVDKFDNTEDDSDLLSIITTVNCTVSLISLSVIVLTAIFFKRWRDNTGNQILLNFTFVIILQIAIFYISNSINRFSKDYLFCTVVGMSLHYSIISQFCWMLVIAVLQFRRFVTVLEAPPKYVLLKACIFGWILPLFPVLGVFIYDSDNYVNSSVGLCYPSGYGLYLGVWLPIGSVIIINSVIFIITLYNVVHKKTEIVLNGYNEAVYQWRLAVMLFFMLGLTWCFGFLSKLELIFEYLFCITATLQGFIVFLFFIVFNVNTRYLYISVITRFCNKNY